MNFQKLNTILLFVLVTFVSFGTSQPLKKYDFDKGGYYLIGIKSLDGDRNGFADSLGDFYTEDPKILNEIKAQWKFKQASVRFACGYHYIVSICKAGLELERFSINLNCNEIVCETGSFYFDSHCLRRFKDDFTRPISSTRKFTILKEARNYRDSILQNSNLILTDSPSWTSYEGTFRFVYTFSRIKRIRFEKREDKALAKLTAEIKTKYPEEQFELENVGGSITTLFVVVKCNKSLDNKFNLHERLEFEKWNPYELILHSYWKSEWKCNQFLIRGR